MVVIAEGQCEKLIVMYQDTQSHLFFWFRTFIITTLFLVHNTRLQIVKSSFKWFHNDFIDGKTEHVKFSCNARKLHSSFTISRILRYQHPIYVELQDVIEYSRKVVRRLLPSWCPVCCWVLTASTGRAECSLSLSSCQLNGQICTKIKRSWTSTNIHC